MAHAVLTFHHPWSPSKSDRLLSLLSSPSSQQPQPTTFTLSTPSTRPRAPSHQLSTHPAITSTATGVPLLILQLAVHPSSPSTSPRPTLPARITQQIKDESLTLHPTEMSAWDVAGGYLSRQAHEAGGKGTVVMVARFLSRAGEDAKQGLVQGLSNYADWVKHNEPATYSYAVLVPSGDEGRGRREVIMFERYRDAKAIAEHGGRKEFKAMFKGILPFIEKEKTVMAEWEEVEGSFVGTSGGEGGRREAKL